MPRRSSASTRSSSPSSSSRPAPVQQRAAPPPAPVPQQQPVMMQSAPQPGMFRQMATLAGGIAGGHVLGEAITGAIRGGGGHSEQPQQVQQQQPAQVQQPAMAQQQQQYGQNPCFQQLQSFLECTQQQADLAMCQGFNDALKDCKLRYGQA